MISLPDEARFIPSSPNGFFIVEDMEPGRHRLALTYRGETTDLGLVEIVEGLNWVTFDIAD
jgi:hypothetical protein